MGGRVGTRGAHMSGVWGVPWPPCDRPLGFESCYVGSATLLESATVSLTSNRWREEREGESRGQTEREEKREDGAHLSWSRDSRPPASSELPQHTRCAGRFRTLNKLSYCKSVKARRTPVLPSIPTQSVLADPMRKLSQPYC